MPNSCVRSISKKFYKYHYLYIYASILYISFSIYPISIFKKIKKLSRKLTN